MAENPYSGRPDIAFWKKSVAGHDPQDLQFLASGLPDFTARKVATAGSCFAQHIGQALRDRGLVCLDMEPAPQILTDAGARRLGYGVYSCRYGNIYTTRQLVQLFDEAYGSRTPVDGIWQKGKRHFDAMRPGVEPNGFGSPEEVEIHRSRHLRRVREMFETLDIFVFTLGLTECWVSAEDGTAYPTAPGVIAGTYDAKRYTFHNFRYGDVVADLIAFREKLLAVNPRARILLTVSPVPLAATATDDHVLVATTYSKAVLRAVAGDMQADFDNVSYFPSFEVITGQPTRHSFYKDDLRSVRQAGVDVVMGHLFGDQGVKYDVKRPAKSPSAVPEDFGFEHCEDSLLGDAGER